jgi:Ca2+-binding RTX toxin-like protein
VHRSRTRLAVVMAVGTTAIGLAVAPAAMADTSVVIAPGGVLTLTGNAAASNLSISRALLLTVDTVTVVESEVGQVLTSNGTCAIVGGTTANCDVSGTGNPISSMTFNGGDGNDTLVINSVAVPATLTGGVGVDTLTGGAEDDTFVETADPADGNDVYTGGGGNNTADFTAVTAPVNVTLDGVANDGPLGTTNNVKSDVTGVLGTAANDIISGVGAVRATFLQGDPDLPSPGGNDTITGGTSVNNVIDGGPGNDTLTGGEANDIVVGGAGNDSMNGAGGDDAMAGDDGTNTVAGGTGDDDIFVGNGKDDVAGGAGEDLAEVDPFNTTTGADLDALVTLDNIANDGNGAQAANIHTDVEDINTFGGNDVVAGSAVANVINTGAGNDNVNPGAGGDTVNTGAGNDLIAAVDQTTDHINCGSNPAPPADVDNAAGDTIDTFVNCETTVQTAIPPITFPTFDLTPPTLSITGIGTSVSRAEIRKGSFAIVVTTNEPAAIAADLAAKVKPKGRALAFVANVGEASIGSGRLSRGTGKRKMNVKVAKKYRKAVRNRRLRLVLRVTATDAAGNRTVRTKNLRVK